MIIKSAGRAGCLIAAAVVLAWPAPGARAVSIDQVTLGESGLGNSSVPGAIFGAASADGTRVIFTTGEALTSDDTDGMLDVYERSGGVTTHLSVSPTGGNAFNDSRFLAASDDAKHVFFRTGEALVPEDTRGQCYSDSEGYGGCQDIYERSNGTTTLITPPASANANFNSYFGGISKDGLHVFFTTSEQLVPADTDNAPDVYERSGGVTTLVSTGPTDANTDDPATFKGCSDDGSHVFFETDAQLTSADTDSQGDVYDRSGGTTTLVSTGPSGGNGPSDAAFKGSSADGSRVFFETSEQLVPADTDSSVDVYERSGGTTTLVSTGPTGGNGSADAYFAAASADGSRVWFETKESLVATDTDGRRDVYELSAGATTLVSIGPTGGNGAFDASFQGASKDGSRVWFGTLEQLAPTDLDSAFDIYERSGGTTTQISLGPAGGNGSYDAFFDGASADGSRVFFETPESLVAQDTDSYLDVYQRSGNTTTLISPTPSGGSTTNSGFVGASDDGSRVFFVTGDKLASTDTDNQSDIYASVDVPGFPRPKGATPLLMPLVIAYRDCTSANTVHGTPLSYPACKPPVPTSDWLTVGTPDSNGQGAKSVGQVRLDTITGDVRLAMSVSDVRNKSGLGDYGGGLGVQLDLRLTDKLNGSSPVDPGTVVDFPFEFDVACATTADTTVGSTCSATTTANAVMPGAVSQGKRAIWQLGTVQVFDGGSDGDPATQLNTLFERQGVFVP